MVREYSIMLTLKEKLEVIKKIPRDGDIITNMLLDNYQKDLENKLNNENN